jgi:cell wall-associated NlpC family hydrolase
MKLALLSLTLLVSACASTHKNTAQHNPIPAPEVIAYARSLLGVPYKYGGSSPDSGFDCSGLVGDVFRHTIGLSLPRSSYEMSRVGEHVDASELQPGDLVFFNTLQKKFSHVGIYLEEGRFIHAPSKNTGKVRIDDIKEDYWKKHYDGARRLSAPH